MSRTLMRLDPPLPLTTPLGDAMAVMVIDEGRDEPLRFVTFVSSTGECWAFAQPEVRLWTNLTEGRTRISPFQRGVFKQWRPVIEGMAKKDFSVGAVEFVDLEEEEQEQ
jgi:hypothetical protein